MKNTNSIKAVLAALVLTLAMGVAEAGGKKYKLVLQINSADPLTQKIVINNALNVQKHFGADNVDIEIVAYGPGLSILTKKSGQKERVVSLGMRGVKLSACGNTIKGVTKRTGKKPALLMGVTITPSGVVRIMELQRMGYTYVRP